MFALAAMDSTSKTYLRKHTLGLRRALAPEPVEALNNALLTQASSIGWPPQGIVHTFLPVLANKEPDTFRIVAWLRREYPAIRIAVPRVTDVAKGIMAHYLLDERTVLEENRWGIPEPARGEPVEPSELDAVLVPLLAFDRAGHRVGYGAGFYDRFLSECRPDVLKIGLSFFQPVARIVDVQPTDVPLDGCITPEQVYWFAKSR